MHTVLKVVFFLVMCVLVSMPCILPEFWLWNLLAPKYFTFLPEAWHQIPYWDFLGLSWLWLLLFGAGKLTKAYKKFSEEVDN